MFTGIVEALGTITSLEKREQSFQLGIDLSNLKNQNCAIGDSISVNGCCLTVVSIHESQAVFDVMEETYQVTALKELAEGSQVNLERALQPSGRLDGHFVSGHVEATAELLASREGENSVHLTFCTQEEAIQEMIPRGSVAVDGVSLTLTDVNQQDSQFSVSLIPHTFKVTRFQFLKVGDQVNIETDMIGKFVRVHVERILNAG